MKINEKMKVRTVAGENIVIMPDSGGSDMTKVIALNPSALLLFNTLQGRDFTLQEAAEVLADEYHIAGSQALSDAKVWLADMQRNGLLYIL
jgi:hypothetical protein